VKQADKRYGIGRLVHGKFYKIGMYPYEISWQGRIVESREALAQVRVCDNPRQCSVKQFELGGRSGLFQFSDTAQKGSSEFGVIHVGV